MHALSKTLLASSAIAFSGLWSTTGFAQEAEPNKETNQPRIIVTADRENELLIDTATGSRLGITALETPAAVNTVDGDDIRALGDLDFLDAVSRAPGVTMSGTPGDGNTALSLRGFNGQGSIMQLYDGVRMFPTAGTVTFPFDTWNVERIEVLNGPGSVLYGQGALGGVVNVVPTSPNFERLEARGEVGYGSFDTVRVAAGVGGPLSDSLAFRVDGIVRRSNGYVDRGESRSVAFSGALEFKPSERLAVTLRHDFGDNHPTRYWGTPLADGETLDTSIREENYNVRDAAIHWRDNRTQLTIDWRPTSALQLVNTSYYLDTRRAWRDLESYYYDTQAGLVERFDNFGIVHNIKQYGDQGYAALTAPLGGSASNRILVGFDVNLVKLDYEHDFASDYQDDFVDPFDFDPGEFLDTVGIKPRYRTRTETWAVYAEDRLALGEQFSVIGGLRYEQDKVSRYNFIYDASGDTIVGETPALAGGTLASKKFDDFTWRVGAVFQPTPTISLYGQYVTGVDPVGTLTTFSTSGTQYAFTNATGNQVEAGAKAVFLNGAGAATVSVYRIVKNDLAVQRTTNGPIEQIGQQSSKGVEATLTFDLPWGLSLAANGTILDANYDDFPGGDVDYTGNTPPDVPESAANLTLQWAAAEGFRIGGAFRYVGRRFSNNENTLIIDSYVTFDLSASLVLSDSLAIDARVYNLFDEDYAISTYGSQQWVLGRPRAWEVALRSAF